jgi:hypothetical protein
MMSHHSVMMILIITSFATQCTPNVYLDHRAHTATTSTSRIAVHPSAKAKRDYDAFRCFLDIYQVMSSNLRLKRQHSTLVCQ